MPELLTHLRALRETLALSRRQAKAFMSRGYAGLEAPSDYEVPPEVLDCMKALTAKIRGATL